VVNIQLKPEIISPTNVEDSIIIEIPTESLKNFVGFLGFNLGVFSLHKGIT